MVKVFIFLNILITSLLSNSLYKTVGDYLDINPLLLKTFSFIETSESDYAMNIQSKTKKILKLLDKYSSSYKYSYLKDKEKYIISVNVNDKQKAEEFYDNFIIFIKSNPKEIITYDLGRMQINNRNIKRLKLDEKKYYLDKGLNIFFAGVIFNDCKRIFKGSLSKTIECYHYGTDESKFTYIYFDKFYSQFLKVANYEQK